MEGEGVKPENSPRRISFINSILLKWKYFKLGQDQTGEDIEAHHVYFAMPQFLNVFQDKSTSFMIETSVLKSLSLFMCHHYAFVFFKTRVSVL